MFFLIGCLLFIAGSIFVFKRLKLSNPYAKGIGMAVALSIIITSSLGQNYTQSLIPEANDGIGVSNIIAYWIIGNDGWSQQLFRNLFETSLYISLVLIVAYPITFIFEAKLQKRMA